MRHTIRGGLGACWRILAPLGIALAATLAACGGGGTGIFGSASPSTPSTPSTPAAPSSLVSGTAASGAPLANILVTMKDSTNKSVTATTSVSGAFTLDSSDLAPPFLLLVTTPGGTRLLSVSTDANKTATINVTPLSDLLVRTWFGLKGQSADDAFANPTTLPPPTPAQLKLVGQALIRDLKLAISANGAPISDPLDLIAKPFTADHTGIDKLIDNTVVSLHSGGIDLLLTAGGTRQTTTLAFTTATGEITATTTTTNGSSTSTATSSDVVPVQGEQSTALDAINAQLASMVSTVNAKGTSLTAADLQPFFDANMLHQGLNRTQFLDELVLSLARGQTLGLAIDRILQLDAAAGKAQVRLVMTQSAGGVTRTQNEVFYFGRGTDGTWRFVGDGRVVELDLRAEARTNLGLFPQNSGPDVNIDVSAPEGVFFDANANSSFWIHTIPFQPEPTEVTDTGLQKLHEFAFTQPLAGSLPAAGTPVSVTISLVSGGTVTYTVPLNAFTTEQIQITSPTSTSIHAGTNTVTWTLPTTYAVETLKLNYQVFTGDQQAGLNGFQCIGDAAIVAPTATSGTVNVPSTCNGLPVTQVNLTVATEGFNGERSLAIFFGTLAP